MTWCITNGEKWLDGFDRETGDAYLHNDPESAAYYMDSGFAEKACNNLNLLLPSAEKPWKVVESPNTLEDL